MRLRRRVPAALAALLTCAMVAAVSPATPIPPGPPTDLPAIVGGPAKAHPTANSRVPQNPYLAANPFSSSHNDSWNSDVADLKAPLGRNLAAAVMTSSTVTGARRNPTGPMFQCGTFAADSKGRILSVCLGQGEASLVLLDPLTLDLLAYQHLPVSADVLAALGSAYYYLDNADRVVITWGTNQLVVLAIQQSGDSLQFVEQQRYDLSSAVAAGDNLAGVMADARGRVWFATAGVGSGPAQVCVLNRAKYSSPASPGIGCTPLGDGEIMRNTFATTTDSAFVVGSEQMYGITAGPNDQPYVMWQQRYYTTGQVKPGQYSLGSGTSPTILGNGHYVAITDNADQLHVVVYRTAARLGPKQDREVCTVPVFKPGAGADENSLVGMGLSLIAENSYGYTNDFAGTRTFNDAGFARVDIHPSGKGCSLVWEHHDAASTVSSRLSTRTGLLYTVARRIDSQGLDVYYWTAMDWRTGQVVWQKQVGTGVRFDSWYPGLLVGRDGTLYSGVYGGVIAMRDGR